MYGFVDDGLYREADFDANGEPFINVTFGEAKLGHRKYVDINKDKVIDNKDRVVIGDPIPDFYGSLSNNLTYKNFDLNIYLQWSYGNDVYNANRILWTSNLKFRRNFSTEVINRWRADNNEKENQYATFRSIHDVTQKLTSKYIEDGSFIRLKTIQLGYSLPDEVLETLKFDKIRIYVAGQNLITWTKYTGYDPEVSTRGDGLTAGVDFGAYPRTRTFITGISFTF